MPKLFYDDEFDALAQVIANSEKTFKECAAYLFPDRKPETAYARLKACLNAEKDERLTLGQIIALCRFCDSYDALFFMADELDHERPAAKSPDDERAAALRTIADASRELKRALDTIERLQPAPAVRAA